MVYDKNC